MKNFKILLVAAMAVACSFGTACGGGSSTPAKPNVIATSGQNVVTITVNSGPGAAQGFLYANGAFANVTVCAPGTATCQIIPGILVDTGSSGLRILSSVLTVSLPQQKTASGDSVVECLPFIASYTWGPVETADVQIGGEKASSVPVQVLSDTEFTAPPACSNGSVSADTIGTLGANGILGIGPYAQDCGTGCTTTTGGANWYYACSSATSCAPTAEALALQVINPVALFAADNNGAIIELPAVSGSEATVSGSLVFGIGTQPNNSLGSATVYEMDGTTFSFTSTYKGTPYPGSFIDSGSNGYFFLDSGTVGLADCSTSSGAPGFYCPSSTTSFTATNEGVNGASGPVTFSIANAETLFSNSNDSVFSQLGGPSTVTPTPTNPDYFDWGLPFFYGRNVYTSIEGTTAPGGTPPYWAY